MRWEIVHFDDDLNETVLAQFRHRGDAARMMAHYKHNAGMDGYRFWSRLEIVPIIEEQNS